MDLRQFFEGPGENTRLLEPALKSSASSAFKPKYHVCLKMR